MDQLAPRLRRAWKEQHPAKEEHLKKVHEVVTQQWEEEFKRRLEQKQEQEESHTQEHDEDQEHDY